jgi:hypothetical protein
MAIQVRSTNPFEGGAADLRGQIAAPPPFSKSVHVPQTSDVAQVLFEQLAYLMQYADKEQERLARVKAILMETFN